MMKLTKTTKLPILLLYNVHDSLRIYNITAAIPRVTPNDIICKTINDYVKLFLVIYNGIIE